MSSTVGELGGAGRLTPTDDRPLTDQEYQLLQRLLSDPFSLPIQFKTWLISYLESSDLTLTMGSVSGLTSLLGISGVGGGTLGIFPAGIILPYGADAAPSGSKMCDGAAYSQTDEKRLWDAIGNRYASGRPAPPAGQFYVPDIRERIPVGKGTLAALDTTGKTENRALGQRGVIHSHSTSTHSHTFGRQVQNLSGPGTYAISVLGDMSTHDVGTDPVTVPVGPAGTPVDGPAFIVLNFIIVS